MAGDDERIDALYGLPLDAFVAERDRLARTLRQEGDRDAAQLVKRLPKPTRAAWAVNAAMRGAPGVARRLAESARVLADVQRELLAGGRPSALREAAEAARGAVEELVAAAPVSDAPTVDKVRATLHAATVDPEVLKEVVAGRLSRDRVASGFGGLEAAIPASRGRRRASAPTAGPAGRADGSGLARPAREAPAQRPAPARGQPRERAPSKRDQVRRRERLRRAKEAEASAEAEATAARRALEQVQSALEERRRQLREAEARLKDARVRRERAEG